MKKNFLLAKQDFNTYLKTNLTGKTKATPLDSITTKESQIIELLRDPDNKTTSLKDDQQDDLSSQSNKTDGSVKDILEPMHENKDNNSLSSILSEIDNISFITKR